MTTPTDTAKLADLIEALAKKHREAADYVKSTPRDCRIPFDKMMELESAERDITRACMRNAPTIVAALRELEAAKAENAKLREALEPFAADAALWDGPDSLPLVEAAPGYSDALTVGDLRRARAALGGAG